MTDDELRIEIKEIFEFLAAHDAVGSETQTWNGTDEDWNKEGD